MDAKFQETECLRAKAGGMGGVCTASDDELNLLSVPFPPPHFQLPEEPAPAARTWRSPPTPRRGASRALLTATAETSHVAVPGCGAEGDRALGAGASAGNARERGRGARRPGPPAALALCPSGPAAMLRGGPGGSSSARAGGAHLAARWA